MSMTRRRMMMKAKEQESSTEELDYLTIIPLHEYEADYYIYPYGATDDINGELPYWQTLPFAYRINKGEWIEVNLEPSNPLRFSVSLTNEDDLQLKCMGMNMEFGFGDTQYFRINSSAKHYVSGTPMSLVYGDDFKNYNQCYEDVSSRLFYEDVGLCKIQNPKTFLPYELMYWCYDSMFAGCENLLNAPELPSKVLHDGCYYRMFYGCSHLAYIKMLATDISAYGCLSEWVNSVTSKGIFVKHPDMESLPTGINGIPEGWAVVNDGEESASDFGVQFPIYLEFDYCEEFFAGMSCFRAGDDLSAKLYNYIVFIIAKYGEAYPAYIFVYEQTLSLLGIEIYLEGYKVNSLRYEEFGYYLNTDGDYPFVLIYSDGSLIYEG